MVGVLLSLFFFFFNDTATTEIYTLSLHDALPISAPVRPGDDVRDLHRDVLVDLHRGADPDVHREALARRGRARDRKSTRLNSSHSQISYAVFCLKKKTTRCVSPERCSSAVYTLTR